MKLMEANDNIELRSERVRKIIGKVPPRLISLGITIVTLLYSRNDMGGDNSALSVYHRM
jgi:hypothetical protein